MSSAAIPSSFFVISGHPSRHRRLQFSQILFLHYAVIAVALLVPLGQCAAPLPPSNEEGGMDGRLMMRMLMGQQEEQQAKRQQQQQLLDRNAFRMSFGKRAPSAVAAKQQKWPKMDGNSFRMSFGKRSSGAAATPKEAAEIMTHANIPIPLLFDLGGPSGLEAEGPLLAVPNGGEQQKYWPSRWGRPPGGLNRKRLDRNLFNIGFGRR